MSTCDSYHPIYLSDTDNGSNLDNDSEEEAVGYVYHSKVEVLRRYRQRLKHGQVLIGISHYLWKHSHLQEEGSKDDTSSYTNDTSKDSSQEAYSNYDAYSLVAIEF